jgi:type II secretory pathway pseudopilin PulG
VQISVDRTPDEGFTLVEVVVSLAVVMVVMTASASFMVDSTRVGHQRSVQDSAAELSMQGMENARGLHGSALLNGRAACTSLALCDPVVSSKVNNLLGLSAQHWDAVGSGALTLPKPGLQSDGSVVVKPSDPEIVLLSGLRFKRYYYISRCWQEAAVDGAADLPCNASFATTPYPAASVRLVVAVTWPGAECGGTCSNAAAALLSSSSVDPYLE